MSQPSIHYVNAPKRSRNVRRILVALGLLTLLVLAFVFIAWRINDSQPKTPAANVHNEVIASSTTLPMPDAEPLDLYEILTPGVASIHRVCQTGQVGLTKVDTQVVHLCEIAEWELSPYSDNRGLWNPNGCTTSLVTALSEHPFAATFGQAAEACGDTESLRIYVATGLVDTSIGAPVTGTR